MCPGNRKRQECEAGTTAGEGQQVYRVGLPAQHLLSLCLQAALWLPCLPQSSLAVTLRRPIVPLVVGLGLLGEEHLVEAAGTEQVSVSCARKSPPKQRPAGMTQAKASDGKLLGAS